MSQAAEPALLIERLSVSFETPRGEVQALRDVSLEIGAGEVFGIAGESGSGKSTLAYAIMRDLASNARVVGGAIRFAGQDLLGLAPDALQSIRGRRIAMVYQDPKSALNPSMRVGQQIAEVLEIHGLASRAGAAARALELLMLVNIPDPSAVARAYPHQLSGGMQQRVVIAMALAGDPALLIMDEPTTGLDVTTQARILELVAGFRHNIGAAILYISHDLAVIAQVSDRVGILYAGELVEAAPAAQLFRRPAHPYTTGLLDALPDLDLARAFRPIRGRLPDLTHLPEGCVFAPRCDFVEDACTLGQPPMATVGPAHEARCLRWETVIATPPTPQARRTALPLPEIAAPVASVESLTKHYDEAGALMRWLGLARPPVHAVDDVTFDVRGGEVLALVGESGCGKTTLGRLLLRLLPPTSGAVSIRRRQSGAEITNDAEFRRVVRIVFQNPDSSLNPTKRVAAILERPLAIQGVPRPARRARVRELLEAVRLDAGYLHRLPRALSGGEKQRVAIARAFATGPELVVLDEPLSALDVSSQASVVDLLSELQNRLDATYVFISHDLSLVRHFADRIGVMYLGRLVELGTMDEIFRPPYHPYTRALLSSIPVPDPSARAATVRLEGAVPSARRPPPGCRFHTRCPSKLGRICEEVEPPLQRADGTHWLACHIPLEDLRRERPVRPSSESGT
jgi:peptide/nickel transport system ATP-binding protein